MSLTTAELDAFFEEAKPNEKGFVRRSDIETAFQQFCKLSQSSAKYDREQRIATSKQTEEHYDRKQLGALIGAWQIPSTAATKKPIDSESKKYESSLPIGRRLQAHWATEGPQSTFVFCVICVQSGLAIWLLVKQLRDKTTLDLLGWGVVLAKTSSGVLYPTLALLLLSSSRTLSTWLRRYNVCSKFINWDLSQVFHVQMAYTAVAFSVLHVIGHLAGTFPRLDKSQPNEAKSVLRNFDMPRPTYGALMSSLPGLSGILSIAIIISMAASSQPRIRRTHFEIFQAIHFLVYPLLGLLAAHGARGWFQAPMLGYWLLLPALLLIYERVIRISCYCRPVKVEILPQTSDVVEVRLERERIWNINPGQYVLLCLPELSRFQWHPFTVSSYIGNRLVLHIRTSSGRWTNALQTAATTTAYIDGPFGAPAEKFFTYDRTIVIGTGIGITPYIGVLSNKLSVNPADRRGSLSGVQQTIDFHWIAREAEVFSWFSSLLNRAASTEAGIKIHTYLTGRSPSVMQHVFAVLRDRGILDPWNTYTPLTNVSLLTGLDNRTSFGRPNFENILQQTNHGLPENYRGNVGVFFCGPKYVGMELSDRCKTLTAEGKSRVQWDFIGEVF